MNSRTFSPIILHNSSSHTPVEPPKVIKQDYSFEEYIKRYPQDYRSDMGDDNDDDDNNESEEESDEEEWDDERNEQEILNELQRIKGTNNKQPVVITKRPSTPPLIPTYLSSSMKNSSSSTTTDYMNKMTLDLMMNPHYLSKANPEAFQRKVEQAQRILKHRREIYKKMDDCFVAMDNLASGNGRDDVDLDIQSGFLHFAKTVLLNIQQQHAGKSGTEPIFSVCNDIYSSFYPEEER